jgi:hypothetical protein
MNYHDLEEETEQTDKPDCDKYIQKIYPKKSSKKRILSDSVKNQENVVPVKNNHSPKQIYNN